MLSRVKVYASTRDDVGFKATGIMRVQTLFTFERFRTSIHPKHKCYAPVDAWEGLVAGKIERLRQWQTYAKHQCFRSNNGDPWRAASGELPDSSTSNLIQKIWCENCHSRAQALKPIGPSNVSAGFPSLCTGQHRKNNHNKQSVKYLFSYGLPH